MMAYEFKPHNNITAEEIAKMLCAFHLRIDDPTYENILKLGLERHFTKIVKEADGSRS